MTRGALAAALRCLLRAPAPAPPAMLPHGPLPGPARWPTAAGGPRLPPGLFVPARPAFCCQDPQPARGFCTAAAETDARVLSSGEASTSGKKDARRRPGRQKAQNEQDLRSLHGVGPKNEQKLRAKGHATVGSLVEAFHLQHARSEKSMLDYLGDSVGILHSPHREAITRQIAELEYLPDGQGVRRPRITLCVEGNISAGKSTFLRMIKDEPFELQDIVEVVPEPVNKWQNVDGAGKFNMLDAFYKDPQRYAYTFQNYVFLTRMMQERESAVGPPGSTRLLERSVFSDRMVFVRAVHEARWMSDLELNIYDSWFDPVLKALPTLIPDGFIYLQAEPGTCLRRMQGRGRLEEGGVSLDYLANLHQKHEEWLAGPPQPDLLARPGRNQMLFPSSSRADLSLQLHQPEEPLIEACPPLIQDDIVYLNKASQAAMHTSLDGVPALVLNCNADLNLEADPAARRDLAQRVSAYCAFVRSLKARRRPAAAGLVANTSMPEALAALLPADTRGDFAKLQAALDQNEIDQLQMRLRAVVTDAMRTAGTPLPHAPPSLAFASH